MTNQNEVKHVKQPMTFNQEEFSLRKQVAKDRYMEGYYQSYQFSSGSYVYPATEDHSFHTLEDLVDFVVEKSKQGQERFKAEPMVSAVGFYAVRFYKPKAQIEEELDAIYQDVEKAYKQEITEHNNAMKTLLAEQLLNAEIAKEEKKENDRLAKMKAKAQADAEEYYSALMENK